MKKIFLLLTLAGSAAFFTGCTVNDDQPDVIENTYTLEAEAFQLTNADLDFEPSTGRYEFLVDLNPRLYPSDVILVYRNIDDNGFNVWQQIPRTIFVGGPDEVDYDFNFNRDDLLIFADANFDLSTAPEFTQNQTFRVVIIPAYDEVLGRMDFSDYNTVAEKYNIKEENIKALN